MNTAENTRLEIIAQYWSWTESSDNDPCFLFYPESGIIELFQYREDRDEEIHRIEGRARYERFDDPDKFLPSSPPLRPPNTHNIPDEVFNQAVHDGLAPLATGGGMDFMTKQLGNFQAVLAAFEDCGSPSTLNESACIILYRCGPENDFAWDEGVSWKVNTTLQAIRTIAAMSAINPTA